MATPQAPQSTSHRLRGPERARPAWLRLLDERDPAGGVLKALLFLGHPGPSLLVTAVTVGAAAIAVRGAPGLALAVRLVFLMLPAQLAIGVVNDLADAGADRAAKPWKPLPRGAVRTAVAAQLAGVLVGVSLGVAATFGWAVLAATVVGLGAGLLYDAGLKRGSLSLLPWWLGFTALPFCAYAAAGRVPRALWWCLPLTAVLALALLCANALPDIEGDRRAGVLSIPVRLGVEPARAVAVGGVVACAALTAVLAVPLHQSLRVLGAAWVIVALAAAAAVLMPALRRAPFPVLALASAALGIAWLASLPA